MNNLKIKPTTKDKIVKLLLNTDKMLCYPQIQVLLASEYNHFTGSAQRETAELFNADKDSDILKHKGKTYKKIVELRGRVKYHRLENISEGQQRLF